MNRRHETYVPQGVSELIDFLAMMLSRAPTFEDDLSPEDSIDTIYVALEKGLRAIQPSIRGCPRLPLKRESNSRAIPTMKTEARMPGAA